MNCPDCNRPIEPNQRFCAGCGRKLQPDALETENSAAANPVESPIPVSAPQPEKAPAPWSFTPGESAAPRPSVGEPAAPPAYEPPAPPAYTQPDAPQFQPPQQPERRFDEQFRRYQQPSQFSGTQPAYQQGYNAPVAPKKGFSPKLLIALIVAVAVVAGAVIGGIFLLRSCTNPARGSYTDALNDIAGMLNAGKYEEAVQKYTIDSPVLTDAERQKLVLLSGIRYDIKVNEAGSEVYAQGSSDYAQLVGQFTSDPAKQQQISEIAAVDATVTVSGNVWGQALNETNRNTLYLARYNGEWKLTSNTSFTP